MQDLLLADPNRGEPMCRAEDLLPRAAAWGAARAALTRAGTRASAGGGQAAGGPAGARRGGSRRVIPQGILCVRDGPL